MTVQNAPTRMAPSTAVEIMFAHVNCGPGPPFTRDAIWNQPGLASWLPSLAALRHALAHGGIGVIERTFHVGDGVVGDVYLLSGRKVWFMRARAAGGRGAVTQAPGRCCLERRQFVGGAVIGHFHLH